jgi:hypothetical protein
MTRFMFMPAQITAVRSSYALAVLLAVLGTCRADEEGLSRKKIAKAGKAATAIVEAKDSTVSGSAFCIHATGFFITSERAVRGDARTVRLVFDSGLKTQKGIDAHVVRIDGQLGLALLRAEGKGKYPVLTLGSDENLGELTELVAFGFPFGTPLMFDKDSFPPVTVLKGTVTGLPRKAGALHRIQLDDGVKPGCSGGPVLDMSGKVIGVVDAGADGKTFNSAIPVSVVVPFLEVPDVQFDPPLLGPGSIFKPVRFEARVMSVLPSAAPFAVDLVLKPSKGTERTHPMEADGDKYRVTAVPVPLPSGPLTLPLLARFNNGTLEATATDQAFKVGEREVMLGEVRGIRLGAGPRAVLHDGKRVEGTVSGLDAVPVRLGEQTLKVNLAKAMELKFAPPAETDHVWYTLVVRQGDKEIFRQCKSLIIQGHEPTPPGANALSFNGTSNYVDMGNPKSGVLDLGDNATLEAWVRFAALPVNNLVTIVSKSAGPGNTPKWIFGYANNCFGISNATLFHVNDPGAGGGQFLGGNSWTPILDRWYHLAVVKAGNSYTFYRDGVVDGTATATTAVPAVAAPFQAGCTENAVHVWPGLLDDVRLWKSSRTQSEIQSAMYTQLKGSETGLAGYWTFAEGSGGITIDRTANHNDGQLGGGVQAKQPSWVPVSRWP